MTIFLCRIKISTFLKIHRVFLKMKDVTLPINKFSTFIQHKIHYNLHKSLPLYPVQSQCNAIHTLTALFTIIHFKIILLPMSSSPKLFRELRFSKKFSMYFLYASCMTHMLCPSHSPLCDHDNNNG